MQKAFCFLAPLILFWAVSAFILSLTWWVPFWLFLFILRRLMEPCRLNKVAYWAMWACHRTDGWAKNKASKMRARVGAFEMGSGMDVAYQQPKNPVRALLCLRLLRTSPELIARSLKSTDFNVPTISTYSSPLTVTGTQNIPTMIANAALPG